MAEKNKDRASPALMNDKEEKEALSPKGDQQEVHKLPIVDPSKVESRGAAPQQYEQHFIWSLTSDTMLLLYKFMFTFVIGMVLYYIATRNVWLFFSFTVVWPMILLVINTFFYRIFVPDFATKENPISIVKYTTFALQNLALCLMYWYASDEVLAEVSTWFVRLNIFEVGIACVVQRLYVLWIPTIMLLLPICGWGDAAWNNFPRLALVKDDHYLLFWQEWNPWFIIIYTGWFLAWVIRGSERLKTSLHTIFPLFVPPQLWFSIRTFCGSFLLWWLYIDPIQKYVSNPESLDEQPAFSEIFEALYVLVFLGAFAMPFLMEYMTLE